MSTTSSTASGISAPTPSTTAAATTTTAVAAPPPRRVADPCPSRSKLALTQTSAVPVGHTPCFRAVVHALWRAVRSGSTRGAEYAFFPLRAYEQVKTIGDPRGDFVYRLLADYYLDVQAAHAMLGSSARAARLVHVIVPQGYAHWVPPGACDNGVGYYEVPNSRLVYRVGGQVRSFGIASMIGWRGIWYVVHLGAVVRSAATGIVDDPSAGTGTSIPSGTC